jgi:hypothetical protein
MLHVERGRGRQCPPHDRQTGLQCLRYRRIAANRDYTVFLLEQAGSSLGAAEYMCDLSTPDEGHGQAEFHLIEQKAFASTLVDGNRVCVDLNRVGMWFADPKDDDFCLGPNSPETPFDADNDAGVQAFIAANAAPLGLPNPGWFRPLDSNGVRRLSR